MFNVFYLVYLIFFLPALYQVFIGTMAMKKKIKISFLTVSMISVLTLVFMTSVFFYHAYGRQHNSGHTVGIGPEIMIIKAAIALVVTIVVQYIVLKTTK